MKTHTIDQQYLNALVGAMCKKRRTKFLKYFSNDVRMELLFSVWRHENNGEVGISDIVAGLSTAPKTNSGMQLFLREMIGIGCFEVKDGDKASKKHLRLNDNLRREVTLHVLCLLEQNGIADHDVKFILENVKKSFLTRH